MITHTQFKQLQIFILKNYNILINSKLFEFINNSQSDIHINTIFKMIFGNNLKEFLIMSEIYNISVIKNKTQKETQLQTIQSHISVLLNEIENLKSDIIELRSNYWDIKHLNK